MKRIAILATHPIQYQAAWFRALAAQPQLDLEVWFCHQPTQAEQSAAGFGVEFDWDVPLLSGYPHRFLRNVAAAPGIGTFNGLDTPEVADLLARKKYDAVLVTGWNYKSAWQTIWACRRTRTPVMTRGDSHLHTPRHPLKRLLKYPFYRAFISRFDACLCVGKWSRDYYLHYGARAERIFFVPHTIDETFFENARQYWRARRATLRRQWQLNEDATVFVFAGKFIEKKRPLDFVRALGAASLRGANVAGLMVGDGPLRGQCEAWAREQNVPVRFAGFLNQSSIVSAYAAGDALALPSDGGETWGMVASEAMFCGLPIIVSDQVGCGPDLVEPGRTGWIHPMGDVDALASTLLEAATHDLAAMGAWAKQRIAEKYSLAAATEGLRLAVECLTS